MINSQILILGSHPGPREELSVRLASAGHKVISETAINRAGHYRADLVLLYAETTEELVGGSGAVRRHPNLKELPLVVAVPEGLLAEIDLSAGMEEIIVFPTRPAELLFRVNRALWKRDRTGSSQTLKIGELTIDQLNYVVRFRGALLDLTLKEYELLCHFASHPGRVFTRATLLNSVWGYEYFGGTRTVDVHIRRLRAKLGDWGEEMIQTVRGVGYRFRT